FFEFIGQEVREHLAALGFRSIAEAVGHAEMLETRAAIDHWKAHGLDLSPILRETPNPYAGQDLHCTRTQDHHLDQALDQQFIAQAQMALEVGWPVRIELPIRNVHRSVGTLLGGGVGGRVSARTSGATAVVEGVGDGGCEYMAGGRVVVLGPTGRNFAAGMSGGIAYVYDGDRHFDDRVNYEMVELEPLELDDR